VETRKIDVQNSNFEIWQKKKTKNERFFGLSIGFNHFYSKFKFWWKTVNRPFSVYRSIFSVSSFHNSSNFDFLNFNQPVFSEPVSLVFIDIWIHDVGIVHEMNWTALRTCSASRVYKFWIWPNPNFANFWMNLVKTSPNYKFRFGRIRQILKPYLRALFFMICLFNVMNMDALITSVNKIGENQSISPKPAVGSNFV
jgi:hypothetical protein